MALGGPSRLGLSIFRLAVNIPTETASDESFQHILLINMMFCIPAHRTPNQTTSETIGQEAWPQILTFQQDGNSGQLFLSCLL